MTATTALLLVAAAWLALGVAAAVVMGRRGRDRFTWLLLGSLLGPLCIPLEIAELLHDRHLS